MIHIIGGTISHPWTTPARLRSRRSSSRRNHFAHDRYGSRQRIPKQSRGPKIPPRRPSRTRAIPSLFVLDRVRIASSFVNVGVTLAECCTGRARSGSDGSKRVSAIEREFTSLLSYGPAARNRFTDKASIQQT